MYYYYDILLNFQDNERLYEFYEWEETDDITFVKKIPLFRVNSKIVKDCLTNQVKFPISFLEEIKNKTILKSSEKNLVYTFLISDTKNALAMELGKDGTVLCRSKILLADEINLNEIMFTMKEKELPYEKKSPYPIVKELRQIEKIKKLINCEIHTLYEAKNKSKLKYLYYEWFNSRCDDLEKIVNQMQEELKNNFDENQQRIYELIKKSYNKVS